MNFAIFINTHGRVNNQKTYETLRRCGYTGKIYLVIDNEDNSDYSSYGHFVFDKQSYMKLTDSGTNHPRKNVQLYARNACEDFAKQLKLDSFVMCDDDISQFRFRIVESEKLKSYNITKNFDKIIEAYNEYLLDANISAISTGMPQMYFSGANINETLHKWRVPYQFTFRNTKFKVNWLSEYGEEYVTAIANQNQFMMCVPIIQHTTPGLGGGKNGMHEMYEQENFRLAQYGYIWNPNCNEIILYKDKFMCQIKRDKAFPKLVSSKYQLQPN